MKLTAISCFCLDGDDNASGNPAGIVENFVGDETQQQRLATELNLPVTVFISTQNNMPVLRFFYPACEMPLCIHGSLGAGFVLMQNLNKNSIQILTHHNQTLNLTRKSDDLIYLAVDRGQKINFDILNSDINQMLNLELNNINKNLPLGVASIGSPKLLIPLDNLDLLKNLKPDFNYIKQWSLKNNINGLYVYVQNKLNNFTARGFNPKGGSNEDAATGVAAGALYEALGIHGEINITQGEYIARPSCIRVTSENNKIFIGGKVKA